MANKQYDNDALMIFRKISEMLNKQIEQGGKLEKNNKTIWTTLHQMDNDIWSAYLHGIKVIEREFPNVVDMETLKTVLQCEEIIDRYGYLSKSGNILTPYKTRQNGHNYKGKAWKLIQQGRETWNRAMNIDLPNDDSSKRGPVDELLDWE